MPDSPEAFSRVLIDRALDDSGWDLLDSRQVRLEFHIKNGRGTAVTNFSRIDACRKLDALFQSMLHRAFRGEL